MKADQAADRNHDPSIRELTSQLDDLKELIGVELRSVRVVMEERDRRYEERFRAQEVAVATALTAIKEQTAANFAASEKAIGKAENAQADYNVRSNEFRGQLDDQAKTLLPRAEAAARFGNQDEKFEQIRKDIASLRESRSEGGGKEKSSDKLIAYAFGAFGLGVALATLLVRMFKVG